MTMFARRAVFTFAGIALLAGCTAREEIGAVPSELTDFKIGHIAVVTKDMVKSPVSRDASEAEWQAVLDKALKDRFKRFEGETFYHLGVAVDGYAIAPPGIPLVMSPKSVLIVSVSLFADRPGAPRLNEKIEQITVFEEFSGETALGSGLTRTKEQQMAVLAQNAATAIEKWLAANPQLLRKTP